MIYAMEGAAAPAAESFFTREELAELLQPAEYGQYEAETIANTSWKTRFRRALGTAALSTAVGVGTVVGAVQHDIDVGKARVADAHSSIHTIYDTDDSQDTMATIVATGLGTKDPSATARLLTPYQKVGKVYALEYSNKDINIDELAQTTERQLAQDHISYLNLDGFSAGGPILAAMAVKLAHDMPDLTVASITMNSSPIGPGSLTTASLDAADTLQSILQIDPDLIYSEKARVLAELTARHDRYLQPEFPYVDTHKLRHEADDVLKTKYANPEAASAALIASQYRFLTAYNVDATTKALAGLKHPPLLVYTRAANPNDDPVVRVDASEQTLAAYARKYKLTFTVLRIANIGHANPGERTEEYNHATDMSVIPAIELTVRHDKSAPITELAIQPPK